MNESSKIIKRLEKEGWTLVRATGSHHHFKHPDQPLIITVPHPRKDLPKGLRHAIMKQAGWL